MIARLIEWSMRHRFLVGGATVVIVALGIHAVLHPPVDAIPGLSENQVIVFADWPGRSPQEVGNQITCPLSANLQGLAGVKTVRATSMFGFSLVTRKPNQSETWAWHFAKAGRPVGPASEGYTNFPGFKIACGSSAAFTVR